MNTPKILIAMLSAVSACAAPAFGGGLFESPMERAQRESSERAWSGARDQLRGQIAEFNQQIEEARAKFWETYPNKPGAKEAQLRFLDLLRQKDSYYLAVGLAGKFVSLGVEDELDGGIRQNAKPEFDDLVQAAAGRFHGGDLMQMARSLTAIDCCPKEYDAYALERDWWEFDHVHRVPDGCDKPETYGVCLYHRWGKLPKAAAAASYNKMIELLGKQLVYDAAKKVFDAPKTEGGLLVVTAPRPVQRGPGGSEVPDDTVPMPEGVIGVYSNPEVAMEVLATKDDDRRYLLFLLKREYYGTNVGKLGVSNKWGFAEVVYGRLKIAFGEKDVLEAAHKVRTAKKRMTTGDVMDEKAIGSTRIDPFAAFQDILARKSPRGYVRSVLVFTKNLDSPAAADAAYKKFVATTDENAFLDAARRIAAGRPNLFYGELPSEQTLNAPPEPETPAETLVDYPEYVAWKKLGPGAKISYATRHWQQARPGSDRLIPEMQYHQAYQFRSINEEMVKLWFTESSYDAFGNAKPAKDTEIAYPAKYTPPARLPPGPLAPTSNAGIGAKRTSAPVESGEETVEINGKRIATRWQSAFYNYDGDALYNGCTLIVKVWTSEAVPTGLIRRTEDKTCPPGPRLPYGSRIVIETYLESFAGFTPAAPDSSKPVTTTYVPPPAAATK